MIRILLVMLVVLLGGTHAGRAACSATTNGTPQTLSFLTSSDFQDGRVAGAISADCFRDLAASVYGSGNNNINLKNLGLPTGGDDTAAINSALSSAKTAGVAVYAPCGTYLHAGLINIDSVKLYGDGACSVFRSTDTTSPNPQHALQMYGTKPELVDIQITTTWTGSRQLQGGAMCVYIDGIGHVTTDFLVRGVKMTGCAAAGVLNSGGNNGRIEDNEDISSLADGFHNCCTAHDVVVSNNFASSPGDDCFPTVQYQADAPTYNITVIGNRCINGAARGLVVEGGANITYTGNSIDTVATGFCAIVASDVGTTAPARDVTMTGNIFKNCGKPSPTFKEAAVFYGSGASNTVTNVVFSSNVFTDNAFNCMNLGRGANYMSNVLIANNICGGIGGSTTFEGITVNGVSNARLIGNTIYNVSADGIRVGTPTPTNGGYLEISSNLCDKLNTGAGGGVYCVNVASGGFSGLTVTNNLQRDNGTTIAGMLNITGNTYAVVSGNIGDNHTQTVTGVTTGFVSDPFNNTLKIGGTLVTVP